MVKDIEKIEFVPIPSFTSLELIKLLLIEIKKYSKDLAKVFPERIERYSDRMLSRMWRGRTSKDAYIEGVKARVKKGGYSFPDSSLSLLEKNLESLLEKNASQCVDLIRQYKKKNINELQLITRLENELGRFSGEVDVTDRELSFLLTNSFVFIRNLRYIIGHPNCYFYYPDFKFSIEKLELFQSNLQRYLGKNAKGCFKLIEKYRASNPDLKSYSKQQYTVLNADFFTRMKNPDQFYWLGFLWADGSLNNELHRIKLELATKDKKSLIKFTEKIGFDISRVKDYIRIIKDGTGGINRRKTSVVKFSCKPMADDLRNLKFLDFKYGNIGLPPIISLNITNAKREVSKHYNSTNWYYTRFGMNALSFLLGFYDGDGHYRGGLSAAIYSTNKLFLDEVKVLFEIQNRVRLHSVFKKYPNEYSLTLGPNLFIAMLESYKDSMRRKRPLRK